MENNLNRVESAISATASGNLTWEQWPHDAATALGLSGQRNPVGFALVRYLGEQNSLAVWGVVLSLATVIRKRSPGLLVNEAKELAFQAFEFWNNLHCKSCTGRGISGIEQSLCPACGGTGNRQIDDAHTQIRDAVGVLMEAERWMEGQLNTLLRRD